MIETKVGRTPKFKLAWTIDEERLANFNFKAVYSIFYDVDAQKIKRILTCTTTKEA